MKSSLLGFFATICLALAVCASLPQQQAKADGGGTDVTFTWWSVKQSDGSGLGSVVSNFHIILCDDCGTTVMGGSIPISVTTNASGLGTAVVSVPANATKYRTNIGIEVPHSNKGGWLWVSGPGKIADLTTITFSEANAISPDIIMSN